MTITDYHAQYFAHSLTKRSSSDSVEKLASVLSDAQVDLNPHQIEAALFAFRSPFSRGAILADEVGLGKTIEAGLLLAQKWAERKQRLLIVLPANLRKQWSQELADKFHLPSVILEARTFNEAVKAGNLNPFQQDAIVLCSYQFVRSKEPYVRQTRWDLVVIDEAHRLRNVYKASSKIAATIKQALAPFPKVLLTATPLQNSLLELYGLVSIIDDYAFGELKSYRARFTRLSNDEDFRELKERLEPLCKRTMGRQVLEYIKYTNRHALVQEFVPTQEEQNLYDPVQSNPRGRQAERFVATVHDYLLIYAGNETECRLSGAILSDDQRADYGFKDGQGRDYRLLGLRQRGSASRRVDRPEMYFPIYVNPETLGVSMDRVDGFTEEVLPRKSTGEDGRWMWGKQKVRRDVGLLEARLIERRREYDIFVRDFLDRGEGERTRKFKTIWDDKGFNTQNGTQEVKALIGSDAMPYPKPVALIGEIIQMGMGPDGIMVDFFAGSGTAADAVLESNATYGGSRKFVPVQLPEPTGREDYPTIAEITKERVRRVIKKLDEADAGKLPDGEPQDRGFRVFKLAESNFSPLECSGARGPRPAGEPA